MEPVHITVVIVLITAAVLGVYVSNKTVDQDVYVKRDLLNLDMDNTTLWLYYDQSDVNNRWWADFGARSSRVLNKPYLNLCYESIVTYTKQFYNIRVLAGLSDVAILLGGWDQLPKPLQNPIAHVGEAELNYIRARILKQFGGLWVNPSTIFINQLPDFTEQENVIFFGTDKDETYASSSGTHVPGTNIMFSPCVDNEIFVELEKLALQRITNSQGGKQFRHDIKWDLLEVKERCNTSIAYISDLEFARKHNGRRIQLEDLLINDVIPIPNRAVYVPIDDIELEERRNFGWFLQMSEEQILESSLFISELFKISKRHNIIIA
jgi:hypothetical protein